LNRSLVVVALVVIILIAAGGVYAAVNLNGPPKTACSASSGKIQIVAAENFWGSLVSQLAGSHANVLSIVSDPTPTPTNTRATLLTLKLLRTPAS